MSAFELSYTHDFIPIPIMMTLVRICPTKLRVSLSYTRDYILIANFVGMALIPFAILTILNLKLFRTIKVVFFCVLQLIFRCASFSSTYPGLSVISLLRS